MLSALRTEGITKKFGSLVANRRIDFELRKGEIHALLGENGSGKSTFLNVLYGLWKPNEGKIFVGEKPCKIASPVEAITKHRIGKVSQHSDLVPTLTVGENVTLRRPATQYGFILDRAAISRKVSDLAKLIGVKISIDTVVETLSVGEQQQVELLKVLSQDAEIVLLDETSALLAPQEVTELFSLMEKLKGNGRSIVFVTHKLTEALRCDRVTVLNKGEVTLSANTRDVTFDLLLSAMFGQGLTVNKWSTTGPLGTKRRVLEIEDISTVDMQGGRRGSLKDVSLMVYAGEILGIAGIAGNGQMELVDTITGFRPITKGRIFLKGQDISQVHSCHLIRKHNFIAYIPEDRQNMGSICSLPISENLILGEGQRPFFFPRSIRRQPKISMFAQRLVGEFAIKTGGIHMRADSLSGGNLQKIILARELSNPADLIIACQPSRGLDFKTTEFVHKKLIEKRNHGKAVLLISYDLDEIIKLADRIAVMFEGRLVEMSCEGITTEKIGRVMTGMEGYDENK